jgi:hypothetical protein
MQCRRCHHQNPDQKFCGACGASLTVAGEGGAGATADPDRLAKRAHRSDDARGRSHWRDHGVTR